MAKKTQKPEGIPLESLITSKDFRRNYDLLMQEKYGDYNLKQEFLSAFIEGVSANEHKKAKHKQASSKGGRQKALEKKMLVEAEHKKIVDRAKKLLFEFNKNRHDIASIIEKEQTLTARSIRAILKNAGI